MSAFDDPDTASGGHDERMEEEARIQAELKAERDREPVPLRQALNEFLTGTPLEGRQVTVQLNPGNVPLSTETKSRVKKFFRRPGWIGKVGSGRPPLWHQYETHVLSVRPDARALSAYITTIRARCGYEVNVNRLLTADREGLSSVDWRPEIKTKKLRCSKCDAKEATAS